jgi:arylsulfatase A-like enzyme/Flp pilus assembly protein TadD
MSARRRLAVGATIAAFAIVGAVASFFIRGRATQTDLRAIPGQNILLITIDTLRADALGSYGGAAATPALDRLAAEGVRFDFAHAHAVLTLTSHASILTGQLPFQHGLRDNSGYRLPPEARTAATLLKQAGYATAAFVGAFPLHSRFGLTNGFDVYDDRFGETRAPTEFVMPERPASAVVPLARQWIAGRVEAGGAGRTGGPGGDAPATRPASPAVAASAVRPWFAWVHVFDPHAPYRPPAPFDSQYAGKPYLGEVAATDAALAPLLDDVRALERPTLVVVTGDHGEALGDHGEQSHGLFAYESTLRVPLIIAQIGEVRPKPDTTTIGAYVASGFRRTSSEVSSVSARHIDILPTILEAAAQAIPADLPGRSLLPAAERRDGTAPRPVYFEALSAQLNRGWAPLTGVLVDRDKYIDLPMAERYDLASDPDERTNLLGRAADRDRALVAALRDFHAATPGPRVAEDAHTTAQLRSLGYVSGRAAPKTAYSVDDDPKKLVEIDEAVHRAVEAFSAGRAADAIQIYQQVVERRPDMAIAYRHLAFIQWQRGQTLDAVATLGRALERGVTDPRVIAQLGGYLADSGRVAEGIRLLEPLARDSTDSDMLNTLGIAYARAGRPAEARQVFERVLTVNPESSVPLENLGVLAMERGDLPSAASYFDRAVRAAPNSSRAHAGRGAVAMKAGDKAAAYDAWTKAVQLDSTNFEALYNLGVNLARDGQLARARPYLEQFLRAAPESFYAQDRRDVAALLRPR